MKTCSFSSSVSLSRPLVAIFSCREASDECLIAVENFEACKRRTLAGRRSVFDRELLKRHSSARREVQVLAAPVVVSGEYRDAAEQGQNRMVSTLKM